jgi:hypothetical protein
MLGPLCPYAIFLKISVVKEEFCANALAPALCH